MTIKQTAETGKGISTQKVIERMSVQINHLDELLSLTGEIIITSSNLSILQRHLRERDQDLDNETLEMVSSTSQSAARISVELHKLVMDIRLTPIKETFYRFRRTIRDLAKKRGRKVDFEIIGEETLVDKTIAEKLYDALAHQIRNAIDHGLEDPLHRKQQKKNPTGKLTLSARKKDAMYFISVSDDGRGLDMEFIKKTALEKELITEDIAAGLSPEACFDLIMQPGFSTSTQTTETSGRGVGMDVVKNVVEDLGGTVSIESEPGQGTTFTYKIPQLSAVNITDALVIRAGKGVFAVPISNVVATLAVSKDEILTTLQAAESILYLDSLVPFHDLVELLSGQPEDSQADIHPVIIIEAKNGRVALKISEFIQPQKLVLVPLPEIFSLQGISGSTILGGNKVGLIIDPVGLIDLAMDVVYSQEDSESAELRYNALMENVATELISDSEESQEADEDVSTEKEKSEPQDIDSRFNDDFFREISDILKDLNEEIFLLEKEPENMSCLNTIFRFFHTAKGNFIMTGFEAIGALVHRLETILDQIRDGELKVNEEIIDLMLDTAEYLGKVLEDIKTDKTLSAAPQSLTEMLTKHQPEEAPERREKADVLDETFAPSSLSLMLLQSKTIQAANVFQCMLKIKPRFQEPFLLTYLILKRLSLLGEIIDTVPTLEKIEKGINLDSFKVLLSSTLSQDELNRFIEKQLVKFYDVTEFETLIIE